MYNSPYNLYNYNPQNINERIDNQIAQLQQMKEQFKTNQQPAINQTFQLAPNNHAMRYANTIDDVNKELVYSDTPFFSKDMSVLWLKSVKGDIRTFELNEIIPKDNKDLMIESLQIQLKEMKGLIENAKPSDTNADDATEDEEPESFSKLPKSNKKQK